jgi:hypothetical protein
LSIRQNGDAKFIFKMGQSIEKFATSEGASMRELSFDKLAMFRS